VKASSYFDRCYERLSNEGKKTQIELFRKEFDLKELAAIQGVLEKVRQKDQSRVRESFGAMKI